MRNFSAIFSACCLVDGLLRLLDERDDVAHAEDARGEAVGVKRVEVGRLFAGADELDRHAGDGLDRERRAAAGVAVELRQHEAGEGERVVEGSGDVDGLLAQRAVGDEQHFVGLDAGAQALHLLDQVVVDLQAAGGVEEDGVGAGLAGGLSAAAPMAGTSFETRSAVEAELLLLRQDLELVDGGGALDVAADDEGPVAALLEQAAELGGRGGFARAVQADQQHLERALRAQLGGALAEEVHQLVMDDLDDLLAGRDGLQHLLAGGLRLHAFDELARDLEVHVGARAGRCAPP